MKKIIPALLLIALFSCKKESPADNTNNGGNPDVNNCQIKEIVLFGGQEPEDSFTVSTEAGTIKEIKTITYSHKFTYNSNKQLIRQEDFEVGNTTPTKIEYNYDSNGNLIEELDYNYSDNNQSLDGKILYQYTNGKITEIIYKDLLNGDSDNVLNLTWTGENVTSISYTNGISTTIYNYTYDLSKTNSLRTNFKYYYWQDPSDDYELIREALFFSSNQLTKMTSQTPEEESINLTYTYSNKDQIKDIIVKGAKGWTFNYDCD